MKKEPRDRPASQEARIDASTAELTAQVLDAISYAVEQRGMTHANFAANMGMTPGWVSSILLGDKPLSLRTVAILAGGLGLRAEIVLIPIGEADEIPGSDVV